MLKHLVMIYLFFFSAWCVRLSSQKGEKQRKRRLNEIPFNPLQTRFPSLTTTKFKSDSSGDASPIELIWKGLLFNTTFHSGARKLEKYVLNIYQHVQNSLFRQMFAVKLVQRRCILAGIAFKFCCAEVREKKCDLNSDKSENLALLNSKSGFWPFWMAFGSSLCLWNAQKWFAGAVIPWDGFYNENTVLEQDCRSVTVWGPEGGVNHWVFTPPPLLDHILRFPKVSGMKT